jgi:hypothetical protein
LAVFCAPGEFASAGALLALLSDHTQGVGTTFAALLA